MKATGAGESSNLTIVASKIKAGKPQPPDQNNQTTAPETGHITLQADHDIHILAGQNTREQHTNNQTTSASFGVGLSTSSDLTFNVALSKGRGKADGEDIVYTHTNVNAGNEFNVQAGNDLNMKGATAKAKQITVAIGRNLNIESLQDTAQYHSQQHNIGVAVSVVVHEQSNDVAASSNECVVLQLGFLELIGHSAYGADHTFDGIHYVVFANARRLSDWHQHAGFVGDPPLLITAARNLHGSTKLRCTIRSTLVGNPGVFHFDPLRKYAVAFFRMSTSIFKLAFSRRRRFNSPCKAATLPAGGEALGCPSLNSFFARHALDQCVSVPRGMPGDSPLL